MAERVARFLAVLLVPFLASRAALAAPAASFTASRTERCTAPCAVFFDATETTDPSTPHPFHELFFEWDFGDEHDETWAVSGRPKNRAIGGIAGHLYARPGLFTVRLRVTNPAGESVAITRSVAVDDPAVVFAGARTRCLSVRGDFDGCPDAAEHVTSDDFDAQLANQPGRRTLLRRGDTFRWARALRLVDAGDAGAALDVFGSGVAPAILRASARLTLGTGAGWTVAHVALHGNGEAAPIAAVTARGGLRRFTLWDVDVRRFNNCVDFWSPEKPDSEIAVVEVRCAEFPDPGNGAKFYEDTDHSMFLGVEIDKGDHVARDDETEFAYRTVFSQKKVIEHGRFRGRGPNQSKNLLQLRHCSAGPWRARCPEGAVPARYVLVSDNHFVEGGGPRAITVIRVCDHAACTGSVGESQPVLDFVFERNLIQVDVRDVESERLGTVFQLQAKQTSVRNNVADLQGWPHGGAAKPTFVLVDPLSNAPRDGAGDLWITHNTVYLGRDYPGSAALCASRDAKGALVCSNNLFVAPGLATPLVPTIGTGWSALGNWIGQAADAASPFARAFRAPRSATLRDLGDFELAEGAGPVDAGADLRPGGFARDDVFGRCRGPATGKPDAGAAERGAAPCGTPPPATL
jgi:PKD domain